MGARRVGDVARCARSPGPTSRSSRTSGVAHLEVFGSWEAIVEASAEPVEALGRDGVAILNADDPVVRGLRGRTAARVVTFGRARRCGRPGRGRLAGRRRPRVASPWSHGASGSPSTLGVPGEHMVANALAAAAAGSRSGVTLGRCAAGLADALASAVADGDVHDARRASGS